MLFGGRPKRPAHDAEAVTLIDVYSRAGQYLESYRLPFGANGMATDGQRFYVIRMDPVPALVGLKLEP